MSNLVNDKLVDKKTIQRYIDTFTIIHRRILNPALTYNIRCYVSKVQGSLVWFEFISKKPQRGQAITDHPRFAANIKYVDYPISDVLNKIPQRGILISSGSNIIFKGTNIIRENNKLVIIKGDNDNKAWSTEEAMKDAQKEVNDIIKALKENMAGKS